MDDTSDQAVLAALRPAPSFYLTRFTYLRALGFVYVVAFLVLWNQMLPLFGSAGLLPAAPYLERVRDAGGLWQLPTLFLWSASDATLHAMAGAGLVLSLLVMLGLENALAMALLWAIYLSFVHAGQLFYGYGWEILLLEAGFLAIFLCPMRSLGPLRDAVPPAKPLLWMLRWLLFRVMLGAGLIKVRGDPCWRELTCLAFHYETQPIPHPLSWLLHQAPLWFHQLGTLFNHFVELLVPWFLFGPRLLRNWAVLLTIAFQGILILSGNLSFLNWLTIAVALGCMDDGWLSRFWPHRVRARVEALVAEPKSPTWLEQGVVALLSLVVLVKSVDPVLNMLSPAQRMNSSFDPLHLVNTYGAFGSVGRERDEVILSGTRDATPGPDAHFVEYELECKPGDVMRRPCLITPYHYRLDWQMWFAALSSVEHEPWLVHLVYKLLRADPGARSMLAKDPFGDEPPRFIRAERYRYHFTRLGDGNPAWWTRERIGPYLPPLSRDNPQLREFLRAQGWLEDP